MFCQSCHVRRREPEVERLGPAVFAAVKQDEGERDEEDDDGDEDRDEADDPRPGAFAPHSATSRRLRHQ